MVHRREPVLDLTRDLAALTRLSTSTRAVDALLGEALDALGRLVPYDLATVMELQGDELRVRVARGPLDSADVRRHTLSLASFPSVRAVLAGGRARAFVERDHKDGDGDPFDGLLDLPHGHACMVVPLAPRDEEPIGVITLDRTKCGAYPDDVVRLADVFGQAFALAIRYGEQSELLQRVAAQLGEENRLLAESVRGRTDAIARIEACRSPAMAQIAGLARQVAASDAPVLVTGETGTGKEVLASAIHAWSPRAGRPFVTLNCAALPEGLIESELFGHVKGAFSGATMDRMGRFQTANGGTLFLDEVGDLPLSLQAKLLRVLQDGTFQPVGSDGTVRVDVRILAATNADLREAVAEKRFREDLYYRLAVFPLHLPPLRARREDVAPIALGVLDDIARRRGRAPWTLSPATLAELEARAWPGNVRELVNALERAAILSPGDALLVDEPTIAISPAPRPSEPAERSAFPTLRAAERAHVEAALRRTGGTVWGEGGAAKLLGVNPSTLQSRMRKLGLGGARDHRTDRS
jgi:transcriptional regulator with GAF, ATPase, and Fis domain